MKKGPFRIARKAPIDFDAIKSETAAGAKHLDELKDEIKRSESSNGSEQGRYNFYFEKLVLLVPTEIVGIYLALYAIGKNSDGLYTDADTNWLFGISIICFFLVFVSRIFGTKVDGYSTLKYLSTAQWGAIIISAISFIIWVYAMGHDFAGVKIEQQRIIQGAVILWTFIVPFFYKGEA